MFRLKRFLSSSLGAALRGAGILAILLGVGIPRRAAAASGCRSDPIVILSDGIVLDVNAMIADAPSDVKHIRYVLHVPDGATVIRAISTGGAVGYKETFQVKFDSALGVYTTEVQVNTGVHNVAVTATIEGGYASRLGITPAMVGLTAFAWTPTTSVKTDGPAAPKGSKGPGAPKGPATLTGTMTAALAAWAETAAWSARASTQGLARTHLAAAAITL